MMRTTLCLSLLCALLAACDKPKAPPSALPSPSQPGTDGKCQPGFERKGSKCVDIDECGFVATPCGTPLATCANKPGGYECTCPKGYVGGGPRGIACNPRVVAGLQATCMIPEWDRRVWCWGAENAGLSPDGAPHNPSPVPTPIAGTEGAIALTMGSDHGCILKADASVACWGGNSKMQLGRDDTVFEKQPTLVPGLRDVIAVHAAGSFTCATQRGGTVLCWGANYDLQLGRDTDGKPAKAGRVPIPPAVAVVAGTSHACGLHSDGTAHCWGDHTRGQLGGIPTDQHGPLPVSGLTDAVQLAAGTLVTGAILKQGVAVWWGTSEADNETRGAVGRSTTVGVTPIPNVQRAVGIAASYDTVCVLLTEGAVFCQGTAPVGDGSELDRATTVRVKTNQTAVGIALSPAQKCLIHHDGGLICWGSVANRRQGDVGGNWVTLPRPLPGINLVEAVRP